MKSDTKFQFRRAETAAGAARGSRGQPGADDMLRAMAKAGFSDTQARRAVVAALCGSPGGLTPQRILARGRARHAHLGYVTVYRTLDILEHLGLARRLHQEDGCSTYAVASGRHGHHVICRVCHRAAEFDGCVTERVLRHAAEVTGYKVDGHWLELFGVCPSCSRR